MKHRTIYKYPLDEISLDKLLLPEGAEILTVQTQFNKPYIWAIVDPANKKVPRHIKVFPTGGRLPDEILAYIGTFQIDNGEFIFHVFEQLTA